MLLRNLQSYKFGNIYTSTAYTSITKDIAQEIVKWEGRNLHLNGLTSIDKDVAHELAKFRGSLELRGLTYLRDDVAKELATWSPKEIPSQKG